MVVAVAVLFGLVGCTTPAPVQDSQPVVVQHWAMELDLGTEVEFGTGIYSVIDPDRSEHVVASADAGICQASRFSGDDHGG
jgi:hypothetical protein